MNFEVERVAFWDSVHRQYRINLPDLNTQIQEILLCFGTLKIEDVHGKSLYRAVLYGFDGIEDMCVERDSIDLCIARIFIKKKYPDIPDFAHPF